VGTGIFAGSSNILRIAGLIVLAALIAAVDAGSGQFNVKELLSGKEQDSDEKVISGIRKTIELYESMESRSCRGVEWKANIFCPLITEKPEDSSVEDEKTPNRHGKKSLLLEGIFIGDSGNYVLINGRMLSVGDEIAGMKISDISLDLVILESEDIRRELTFDSN